MIKIYDPKVLGDLEVGWWRAHHGHDKQKMAQLLVEQNVLLYGFTPDEAKESLRQLVRGVNYHDTRDWGRAIEAVTEYYRQIKDKTQSTFDPEKVAKLEVDWWRLHDELEHNPDKSQLAEAFVKLYSTQFGVSESVLSDAGKIKAEATREHDLAEDPKTPPEEVDGHWNKANQLLVEFYVELRRVLEY